MKPNRVISVKTGIESLVLTLVLTIAGCSIPSHGYYGGDSHPQHITVDLDAIADAIPRDNEPLSATGNKPYHVLGKTYRPLASADGYVKRGIASWYGSKFQGRRTSSGEPYDLFAMTAAHPRLPLPSYVRVTNLDNKKSVVVRVNDRGPFLHNRIIDLSYAAAYKLDILKQGTGRVEVRAIKANGQAALPTRQAAALATNDADNTLRDTFLLQIGAYASFTNANNLRQRLERAGYQVVPFSADSSTVDANTNETQQHAVYRVQVGPFTNSRVARSTQKKLESLLGHAVAMILQ